MRYKEARIKKKKEEMRGQTKAQLENRSRENRCYQCHTYVPMPVTGLKCNYSYPLSLY